MYWSKWISLRVYTRFVILHSVTVDSSLNFVTRECIRMYFLSRLLNLCWNMISYILIFGMLKNFLDYRRSVQCKQFVESLSSFCQIGSGFLSQPINISTVSSYLSHLSHVPSFSMLDRYAFFFVHNVLLKFLFVFQYFLQLFSAIAKLEC